ncbi:MAG: T9SS type A sorting domain-containing protein, partial [Candidatus Marinimicrobia bacterium]|nr:T9SS type A sorting domain-containing protein [Candidatus Neomarinimicrobiota bacterium]
QFQIKPGIQIYSVSGDMKNQVIVTLNCSDFVPETDYQLKAWSLEKWDGTKSDTLFFQFRYVPGQIAVIDNEDPLFTVQSGDWQMDSSAAKFYGNNYVKTPCGDGTARVFWRYQVPISGYYRVMALFPDSTAFATDAMYLLKKGTEFDTIRVDQTKQLTNSVILGDIWADDGSYIVVKLHNQSGESLEHWVVADAIRISRIFYGTGIDRDDKLQKPDFIRLFPNYPNPFNSSTKIEYEIQFSSKVQLRIYDLTGRLTRQIEQYSGPGRYSFQVDCANLPSGIYLYQVVAGKHILTGKMMVLR